MRQYKNSIRTLVLSVLIACGTTGVAWASQSSSASYSIDETQFGSGSILCDPGVNGSASYCADQNVGDTAVGNSSSASYQIQAGGSTTDRDNSLELKVNLGAILIGQLSTATTKTATATFSVKSYLSSGYAVRTISPGPTNFNHVLQPLTAGGTSTTGTEQFGINLAANSCPANTPSSGPGSCSGSLGASPGQVPDTTFSFGHASTGYATANTYRYNNGDTIAGADSSSGETDYTISYLFNISGVTPGGAYLMQQVLVATASF